MTITIATPPAQEMPASAAAASSVDAAPDVSIIIVNWNAGEHLQACLESIDANLGSVRAEVMVVDNDSSDGMADHIEANRPGTRLLRLGENLGFAAANNRALHLARGRFLLLLNPDTEINSRTLPVALAFAEANPDVGVVGVRSIRPDGSQQSTMFRLPRLRDLAINVFVPNRLMRRSRRFGGARYADLDLEESHDVEAVAGCFMLVRREVYRRVGGLDETFFMYGEEAEWCHRIARSGWRISYLPDASILHHGGVCAEQCPDEMNLAMARSQLLLFRRTRGRAAAIVAGALMIMRDLPRAVAWRLVSIRHRSATGDRVEALRRSADRLGPIMRQWLEIWRRT